MFGSGTSRKSSGSFRTRRRNGTSDVRTGTSRVVPTPSPRTVGYRREMRPMRSLEARL